MIEDVIEFNFFGNMDSQLIFLQYKKVLSKVYNFKLLFEGFKFMQSECNHLKYLKPTFDGVVASIYLRGIPYLVKSYTY